MVLAAVDHSRLTEPIININEIKVVGMEAEKNDAHSNWHASQFLVTFAATLQSCRFSLFYNLKQLEPIFVIFGAQNGR